MKMYFSQEEQTERACVLFQLVSINVLKTSVKCFRPNLIESHYLILSKSIISFNVSFLYRKKNGLNFLLRNHFCFAVLRPGTDPCDYEAVSRNLPPIIFCARFEFTWFRKSPDFNKI